MAQLDCHKRHDRQVKRWYVAIEKMKPAPAAENRIKFTLPPKVAIWSKKIGMAINNNKLIIISFIFYIAYIATNNIIVIISNIVVV